MLTREMEPGCLCERGMQPPAMCEQGTPPPHTHARRPTGNHQQRTPTQAPLALLWQWRAMPCVTEQTHHLTPRPLYLASIKSPFANFEPPTPAPPPPPPPSSGPFPSPASCLAMAPSPPDGLRGGRPLPREEGRRGSSSGRLEPPAPAPESSPALVLEPPLDPSEAPLPLPSPSANSSRSSPDTSLCLWEGEEWRGRRVRKWGEGRTRGAGEGRQCCQLTLAGGRSRTGVPTAPGPVYGTLP